MHHSDTSQAGGSIDPITQGIHGTMQHREPPECERHYGDYLFDTRHALATPVRKHMFQKILTKGLSINHEVTGFVTLNRGKSTRYT